MRLGFCGLGSMGRPMAARLLGAGHEVAVWNRTPERADPLARRGGRVAPTPAEAARGAQATITMVADAGALEEVVFGPEGVAAGMEPGSILVDMSTVGPGAIRSVAARLPAGVEVLDAPVKGGPANAEAGELGILVGGSEEAFRRMEGALAAIGTPVRLGPLGTGAAAKVLNNFAVLALTPLLGEALLLARALEMDEGTALDVLAGTPLGPVIERQWGRITGDQPASFKLGLARKDLDLAVRAARGEGVVLRLGEEALRWLGEASERGLGQEDHSTVVRVIRGGG